MKYIELDPHPYPHILYSPAANQDVDFVSYADSQYYELIVHILNDKG